VFSNDNTALEVEAEQVQGRTITHVSRVGKYIVFKLDHGYLVSHLRMTGQWHFSPAEEPNPVAKKHFRWAFTIRGHDGKFSGFLWFKDVRRFGTMVWVPCLSDYPAFQTLGPDGLSLDDPKVVFQIVSRAAKTRRPIKNFLLDQDVIAGVGNLYASEALFETRTNPKTSTKKLSQGDISSICAALHRIFKQAIDYGGSSISDYMGGRYQEVLKVYGREGLPCYDCNTTIERVTQAGRGTFLCPKCQGVGENELF